MIVGDIVYLKSGSRPMTVIRANGVGKWECAWDSGAVGSATYPEAALTTADPRPALRRAEQSGEGTL